MKLSSPIKENNLINKPKISWPIHDHVSAITVITNVIAQSTYLINGILPSLLSHPLDPEKKTKNMNNYLKCIGYKNYYLVFCCLDRIIYVFSHLQNMPISAK